MANRDEYIGQIGQFFGMIDPILMVNLVNMSLFTLNKTYDYQSVCDPKRESKGSAAGLRSVYVVSYISQRHTHIHTHRHQRTINTD
uniref:Voltage-dependent calcium channel alpha-2/delta subunit conserved region domain-containing protein n=1 Tax=Hucho hucho TaxID=62062 RepID=A0A4W5L7D2_9TELE